MLESTPIPRWFLTTSGFALVFWCVAYLWLQFLYQSSSDPGGGFALFLALVFFSFVRRSYLLQLPASPASLRHAAAVSAALLSFAAGVGIGVCVIRQISA